MPIQVYLQLAKICKKARVTGLVQGVFFRMTTQQQAKILGLTGFVRNLSDGSVEVLACGETEQVNKLIAWLHVGSQKSRVDQVNCELHAFQAYPDFEVRR